MTVPHYMAGVDRDYRPRERRRSPVSKLDRMLERIKEQRTRRVKVDVATPDQEKGAHHAPVTGRDPEDERDR